MCGPDDGGDGDAYELTGAEGNLLAGLDALQGENRIREFVAQWLQMEHVVVLLGAGASTSHGGPLMASLEQDVLGAYGALAEADESLQPFLPVVSARLAEVQTGEAPGFERWLSAIASLAAAGAAPKSPIASVALRTEEGSVTLSSEQLSSALDSIAGLIRIRCSLRLPALEPGAHPTGHHAFVAKLIARDPVLGRAQIFTTNYDTLIEQALDALGIRYADGFVGTIDRRFDASSHVLDLYFPGEVSEGRVRRYDKYIHLHKLHGSVDWQRSPTGEVRHMPGSAELGWREWGTLTPEERTAATSDSNRIAVLPTDGKYVETLGMPYAHNFRALQQALQAPQTALFVLGYGFQDEHINALIEQGMTNPGIALLVVDPYGQEALRARVERYQGVGNRAFLLCGLGNAAAATPTHATFDDFSKNLLPNVRWLDDYLRLRRVEAESGGPPNRSQPE